MPRRPSRPRPERVRIPETVVSAIPRHLGDLGAGHPQAAQGADHLDAVLGGAVVDAVGGRGAIEQAGLALGQRSARPTCALSAR